MIRRLGLVCLLLTGCTNDPAGRSFSVGDLWSGLRGNGDAAAARPGADVTVTRALIDALPVDTVILVRRQATGAFTFMSPVGAKAGAVTYMSQARDSVTLRGPSVVATNGFGADLSGVEPVAGGRTYLRLDAENSIERQEFSCTPSQPAPTVLQHYDLPKTVLKVEEVCTSGPTRIENRYWLDAQTGLAWRSEQWIGPEFGHLTVEILKFGGAT